MNKRIITILFILSLALSAPLAQAAQIRVVAPSLTESVAAIGSEINIDFLLNSDEGLNAIEGEVAVSSAFMEILDVNDGNSIISLWIIRPKIENGKIIFAGVIPGGFSGQNGKLFSARILFKNSGIGKISFTNLKGFLNDGQGTQLNLSGLAKNFQITKTGSEIKDIVSDLVPPEDFTPVIGRDEQLFDGKYFLTFTTQDKGAGVDYYEVAEKAGIFKPGDFKWQKAVSPHLLTDQDLGSWIFVRAIDKQGNERIGHLQPESSKKAQRLLTISLGIIVIMLLLIIWRRFRSRKKR